MANMHLVTGHAGKEHVTAADQGSLNAAIFGTDQYVLKRGNQFAATVVSNNLIQIADGDILMQGRHIRLNEGEVVDLVIENGTQGTYRNDLIVARYTRNISTDVEDCNLVVIKGAEVGSNPVDPEYTIGDIINDHAIQNDMPLYRVPIVGIYVQELVPLFERGSIPYDEKDPTVPAWAKQSKKPSYTAAEVGADVAGAAAAVQAALTSHNNNSIVHITAAERTAWNNHSSNSTIHITATERTVWNNHSSNSTVHITAAERSAWNGKAPAYQYSTTDLTAGSSSLATGTLYFVYK